MMTNKSYELDQVFLSDMAIYHPMMLTYPNKKRGAVWTTPLYGDKVKIETTS